MPKHSYTADLMRFFRKRPHVWIEAREFEQFGRQAWRTRISDARKLFEAAKEGTIENRVIPSYGNSFEYKRSQYRFVPSQAPQDPSLFAQEARP